MVTWTRLNVTFIRVCTLLVLYSLVSTIALKDGSAYFRHLSLCHANNRLSSLVFEKHDFTAPMKRAASLSLSIPIPLLHEETTKVNYFLSFPVFITIPLSSFSEHCHLHNHDYLQHYLRSYAVNAVCRKLERHKSETRFQRWTQCIDGRIRMADTVLNPNPLNTNTHAHTAFGY